MTLGNIYILTKFNKSIHIYISGLHYDQVEDGWDEVEIKQQKKKRKRKKERQTQTGYTEWNTEGLKAELKHRMGAQSHCLSWGQHLFDPSSSPGARRVSGSAIPQSSFKGWLTFKHLLSELGIGSAFICKLQSLVFKRRVFFPLNLKDLPTSCKEISWVFFFKFPLCNFRSV